MERDLEDLRTRMRRVLEDPKKVAEIAVAALSSPYNAYKVVLESTKDKQLAQDWRNTLILKRDQEKYGIKFLDELTSVFPEKKKEDKMLEALKEREDLRKRQEEVEKISKILFRNSILLLIKKGEAGADKVWRESPPYYPDGGGPNIEVPVPSVEYTGEMNRDGVSVPVCLHVRKADKKELLAYLQGDIWERRDHRGDMNMDLSINVDKEKSAVWFSCLYGRFSWMNIFYNHPVFATIDWYALPWTQIEFLKELNAWVERQMES